MQAINFPFFLDESQGVLPFTCLSFVSKQMNMNYSSRKMALNTGIAIIIMTILAGFVMAIAFNALFNPETAGNQPSHTEFLSGILGWIGILICDLIVSNGIFQLFRTQKNKRAQVTALLRYIYSFLLAIGIVFLFKGLIYFDSEEVLRQNVALFKWFWSFGLIIFGFHLTTLSRVFCDKNIVRRLISILLFSAGIGYIFVHGIGIFLPQWTAVATTVEPFFIPSMILGEFGFAIWLIAKGAKSKSLIIS